jgi:hypothetical protein
LDCCDVSAQEKSPSSNRRILNLSPISLARPNGVWYILELNSSKAEACPSHLCDAFVDETVFGNKAVAWYGKGSDGVDVPGPPKGGLFVVFRFINLEVKCYSP